MGKIRKAKAYNELESAWIQKDSKNMFSINYVRRKYKN